MIYYSSPLGSPLFLGRGLPETVGEAGERQLLRAVWARLAERGLQIAPLLVVDYYLALKTGRSVALVGPQQSGKALLSSTFAELLVGGLGPQVEVIQGRPPYARYGRELAFFTSLYERFGWARFVDALERAADPDATGKVWCLCLEDVSAEDLGIYAASLAQEQQAGGRPANVLLTATLHAETLGGLPALPPAVELVPITARWQISLSRQAELPPPPSVGVQRRLLAPPPLAAAELAEQLSGLPLAELRPRSELVSLLGTDELQQGSPLYTAALAYVNASYDLAGVGLLDATDRTANALLALDLYVSRRAAQLLLHRGAPVETIAALMRIRERLLSLSDTL